MASVGSCVGLVATEGLRGEQSLPPTLEMGPGEDLSRLQDHLVSPTIREHVPSVNEPSSKWQVL